MATILKSEAIDYLPKDVYLAGGTAYDRKIGLDPNISISYINLIFHTFSEFLFCFNLYFFINMSKNCIII